MPTCKKCNTSFPNRIKINDKIKHMYKRKYCLICSPFGSKNTKQLEKPIKSIKLIKEKTCSKCKTLKPRKDFHSKGGKRKNELSGWCKKCSNRNTQERQHKQAINRKILFIKKKGGKCIECGYKKHMSGLTFHHRDPNKKEMSLDARSLGNSSLNKCLKELDKCDLICSNCHNELHNPQFDGLI